MTLCYFCGVKREAGQSEVAGSPETGGPLPRPTNQIQHAEGHRGATYQKARDARKRPIRGLWVRNGRFYAQMKVKDPNTRASSVRRVPLEGATTVPEAVRDMARLKTKREDNQLPILRRSPTFAAFADEYFKYFEAVKDVKRPATIEKERGAISKWVAHLGGVRLNQITKPMVTGFMAKRQAEGVSGRTVNLDVIALRNVLKKAVDDGWITNLPTVNLRPLKWTSPKRELVTEQEI